MAEQNKLRSGQSRQRSRHRRKRNQTVALGAGILIFAVIGICLVVFIIVKSATGYVQDYVGPDETASYFETYLEPVVMFDPDTFTDVSKAQEQWKVETAIWAALDENEKNGIYASTSDGREILPIKDVNSYLKKYFGGTVSPAYKSFSDGNFTYEFNKKEQCFYIPLTAVTNFYMPRVTNVSNGFNTVTLTVQYIPGENWGQDSDGNVTQPTPDKTMTIVLSGSRGSYTVKSISEDVDAEKSTSSQILDSSGKNDNTESSETSSSSASSSSSKKQ
jgi:hypothetical protein